MDRMTQRRLVALVVACVCLLTLLSSSSSLTIHLVPHTHNDVGWIKTVDQYYTGQARLFSQSSVAQILTSVIAALKRVPERKFIYVEQAFFQRWWRQQSAAMQSDVRALLSNGQLEFINGGWCMHDEATSHAVDMIDQTTLGHQYIVKEFGEQHNPRIGWQIDPFGHSSTQAALMSAQVGFEALFIGRIDYQDHDLRMREKRLQFVWAPSPSDPDAAVFTEASYDGNYNPPAGFCWDRVCNFNNPDPFIQDDPRLDGYNVEERLSDFLTQARAYAATRLGPFDTMHIQWNMGSDFQYENAEQWFTNLDKLISIVNNNAATNDTIRAMYSTPSQYYTALQRENLTYTVKIDDVFPYISDPQSIWTGFFTSRAALKGYVRTSSILLQTARQLELFAGGDGTGTERAWEAMGVAQHHDALTGTEMQAVAYDYAQRLSVGNRDAYQTMQRAMAQFVTGGNASAIAFQSCLLLNVSACAVLADSVDSPVLLGLYNPAPRAVERTVMLPVYSKHVTVSDSAGRMLLVDLVPVERTRAALPDTANHLAAFRVSLPALGYSVVSVLQQSQTATPVTFDSPSQSQIPRPKSRLIHQKLMTAAAVADPADVTISNAHIQLTFDGTTGLLTSWTDVQRSLTHPITQKFYWYQASNDSSVGTSSPYTFRPANGSIIQQVTAGIVDMSVHQGPLVQQVTQRFSDWVSQVVRLFANATDAAVHIEWTIGPIPIGDAVPKEIVTRYTTNIASQSEFWTDANGRELQRRVRNARPSWNWTSVDGVSSNYYPITTMIGLNDSSTALWVLNDRAQGGSSLNDGEIELMLHRRLLCGWDCGFIEPLNETDPRTSQGLVVSGTHKLLLLPANIALDAVRLAQHQSYTPLEPFFAPNISLASVTLPSASFMMTELPLNVALQTLQVLWDGSVLLRLAHTFAVNESNSGLSDPVEVDIGSLFTQRIASLNQTTLTANAAYETLATVPSMRRHDGIPARSRSSSRLRGTRYRLMPMEIATFRLQFLS